MTSKNDHHKQKDPEPDKTTGSSDHHHSNNDDATTASAASSQQQRKLASIRQVFSFGKGFQTKLLLLLGAFFAAISGLVVVGMVFYMTKSYSDLSAPTDTDEFMEDVKELCYSFLGLGAIAFISLSSYSALLQTAAGQMTTDLKIQWYQALLRQDLAYFDIMDVSGTATVISTNAAKYNRGVGNKLGLAIQFTVTFVGGLAYAFWSSWQTSLITLLTVPFMAASGWFLIKMNTSQSQRANASYAEAGSIVYTTVTSIRTILSLNGARTMIAKFKAGTTRNFQEVTQEIHLIGLANGSLMSSFLLSSIAVPLFGGFLLYDQILNNGCDPSGAVPMVETCSPSGSDIFGAMFGIFLAASVLPQISTMLESFIDARAACALALEVMNRQSSTTTDNDGNASSKNEETATSIVRRHTNDAKACLPEYVIDSSSPAGLKPPTDEIQGEIRFDKVTFAYPTRSETKVLNELSLLIPSGKTVAIVGSSGSGKSTVAQLVERFYDPIGGKITLDGTALTDLNVGWLREQIGLVSQEPSLFACSIRENIAYGFPGATMEQIEEAARVANCYDFITSFPNGFETQVGDRGTKMSGGQKQRIAIARVIIKNPKILILDEATSALDSESERTVQMAIDSLLEKKKCTTIVIAHRLSTIRHADIIAVLADGKLAESGSHEALMKKKGAYYGFVDAQKAPVVEAGSDVETCVDSSFLESSESSFVPATADDDEQPVLRFRNVRFNYPSRPDSRILDGFNLSVKKGETLALVGPSGHGKSTLIQLAMRFYDPVDGSIELDGRPLTKYNPTWLRSQFGLVSQEPTLFDTSIAENIKFGLKNVTQEEIEKAARDANAHDFIMGFPDGYGTQVGEGGAQISGGQKQRCCIARLLLRHSKVLLLDEATSALDSESERLVQEALDRVMALENQTTIVVAHRLSTIRNADRIAVIMNGKVQEIGPYGELMAKQNGHFRRLQAFQNMDDAPMTPDIVSTGSETPTAKDQIEKLKEKKLREIEEKEKEQKELEAIDKGKEKRNASRARELARGNEGFFVIGAIGALLAGAMFPAWGLIFAYMIKLLYTPVPPCEELGGCDETYDQTADDMKQLANNIAYGSVGTIGAALIGYILLFYGFGQAAERINKRIRDEAFESLIRQEVSWFDLRPVGKLTSQLQDDAALIHSFSGQPIRILVLNLSSVFVGIVLGFFYMWEFALLFLAILPFMGFGAEMEMRMYVKGEDEGDDSLLEDENSPGGIVVESLTNMKSVASLCLERIKLKEYGDALKLEDPRPLLNNFLKGCGFGLGQFFQFWGMALMYWFGAWILHNNPDTYDFTDFVVSMFALFFSLYGLTVALEGATDRKRATLAADRIFDLIDRKSAIDPLSDTGFPGKESIEGKVRRGASIGKKLRHLPSDVELNESCRHLQDRHHNQNHKYHATATNTPNTKTGGPNVAGGFKISEFDV